MCICRPDFGEKFDKWDTICIIELSTISYHIELCTAMFDKNTRGNRSVYRIRSIYDQENSNEEPQLRQLCCKN
jgi:hypothetical protein